MINKKTYLYEIGEVVNGTLRIVNQIEFKQGVNIIKGYLVKSLAYPDDKNDYEINEYNLKKGVGCAYLKGNRICPENSLYSIKHIRDNIIDVEQAKKIAPYSNNPIFFKCSTNGCSNTKMIRPSNLLNQGFACDVCSKNISYGQLSFECYQLYNNLGFESEKILPELPNRRVDFINWKSGMWIEIQGIQHTDERARGYKQACEQDEEKRAFNKNSDKYNLIEIDMHISSWEHFKKQINNEPQLPSINDEDEKVILEMMENNKRYPIKEIIDAYLIAHKNTYEIAEMYNVSDVVIGNILRRQNIETRNNTSNKLVKCTTTGKIYQSSEEAARDVGLKSSTNIMECVKGRQKTAGKHPVTNERLTWEYPNEIEIKAYYRAQCHNKYPTTIKISLEHIEVIVSKVKEMIQKEIDAKD